MSELTKEQLLKAIERSAYSAFSMPYSLNKKAHWKMFYREIVENVERVLGRELPSSGEDWNSWGVYHLVPYDLANAYPDISRLENEETSCKS
uniref:Uncharacterized protein n=2 Tax=Candidatus Kentrum sp. SD TaxID=2126332 RepID=A0A450YDP0_9GAMM|nr:MAG: hypothetical protein BECKSD772F_GA0070984_10462 [Candidatus Kentron sp. SD]VFK44455.1 MAG: hypothetical protein BECKSD772E_GA0070983_10382 [Candidatus Kentron sp. SD]